MNDQAIEQAIQAKGKTAARVTPGDIEAEITHTYYVNVGEAHHAKWPDPTAADEHHPSIDLLTICVLVLKNGFTVTGEAACSSPEDFDAQTSRDIARANAIKKICPLMDSRLRDQAPEMLRTLQWIIQKHDDGQLLDGEVIAEARSAIAKATS